MAKPEDPKKMAYRMARYMGCSGVHQNEDGVWMPCGSQEELMRLSDAAEPKKKTLAAQPEKKRRKKRGKDWEKLRESGVMGIDTLPGGGLVSGTGLGGKAVKGFLYGRAKPRLGDPDVFTSPDGARLRSRQLGCIGIARRQTPDGDVVWTPCSNMSDYRRRRGVGGQARRDREREERRLLRRLRRLGVKAAKPKFNSDAEDGDGDGIVQEGTPFQRVATPDVGDVVGDAFASKPYKIPTSSSKPNSSKGKKRGFLEQRQASAAKDMPNVFSELKSGFKKRRAAFKKNYPDAFKDADSAKKILQERYPNVDFSEFDLDMSNPSHRGLVIGLDWVAEENPITASQLTRIATTTDTNRAPGSASPFPDRPADELGTPNFNNLSITFRSDLKEAWSPEGLDIEQDLKDLENIGLQLRTSYHRMHYDGKGADSLEALGTLVALHEFGHVKNFNAAANWAYGKNISELNDGERYGLLTGDASMANKFESIINSLRANIDAMEWEQGQEEEKRQWFFKTFMASMMNQKPSSDVDKAMSVATKGGRPKITDFMRDGLDEQGEIDFADWAASYVSSYAGMNMSESIAETFAMETLLGEQYMPNAPEWSKMRKWLAEVKADNMSKDLDWDGHFKKLLESGEPEYEPIDGICSPPPGFYGDEKPAVSDKKQLDELDEIHAKLTSMDGVEVKKVRKARSDRAAATPALPNERIRGSDKNPKGSAASASSASKITLSEETINALKNKVKEHNEKMRKQNKPQHTMASLGRLKSVWRRGAGAFSASHRPGMTRSRWAFARVNAFLYLLEKGKPRNSRYTTDNDLLPKGHPRKGGSKNLPHITDSDF